jgi:hypothetical protein
MNLLRWWFPKRDYLAECKRKQKQTKRNSKKSELLSLLNSLKEVKTVNTLDPSIYRWFRIKGFRVERTSTSFMDYVSIIYKISTETNDK